MSKEMIKEYVDNLRRSDIKLYALWKGIPLSNEEVDLLYEYINKHWYILLYGNELPILEDLKTKLDTNTYQKLERLYYESKQKYRDYL